MTRVSVIIPLYNKRKTIRRAIDSILAQSERDLEVIVVDDGSTDGSSHEVSACVDSRVRLVCQENQGPGAARNAGVRAAQADTIAFLDADDEWSPRYLERSLGLLDQQNGSVLAVCSACMYLPDGTSSVELWARRGLSDGVHGLTPDTSPGLAIALLAFMWPCSTVIRRGTLTRFGGFFSKYRCLYGEDSFLFLKLLLNGNMYVNLSPLARYHREDSDLTHTWDKPREIEPILTESQEIVESCPPQLVPLLSTLLKRRAAKTACVLAYWGRWREAHDLLDKFRNHEGSSAPYLLAYSVANPIGATAARGFRGARRWVKKSKYPAV